MKALMALQEEQEEYILKTQREKQELKQEMENKSRALDEAQRQLEEVRANRHRVDQDVVVRTEKSLSHFAFKRNTKTKCQQPNANLTELKACKFRQTEQHIVICSIEQQLKT